MTLQQIWAGALSGVKEKAINTQNGKTITVKIGEALLYDDGTPVSLVHAFGGEMSRFWLFVEPEKIKVTMNGKDYFISKESAEEFKRMLS